MLHSLVLGPFTSRKMPGLLAKSEHRPISTFLADLMRSGKVTPVLDRTYPLKETADAIRYIEQGHARGKVASSPVSANSATAPGVVSLPS